MSDPAIFSITLLRHGESLGNAANELQGHTDIPLSEQGCQQVARLARYWRSENVSFDHIISSPLHRAQHTAHIIAEALGLPVETNPLWIERCFGALEGKTMQEMRNQKPAGPIFDPFSPFAETGDSVMEVYTRACQAVQDLLRMAPGRYLVVSHGAFLNMILYAILGMDPQKYNAMGPRFVIDNAAYTLLSYDPGQVLWRMYGYNLRAPVCKETPL